MPGDEPGICGLAVVRSRRWQRRIATTIHHLNDFRNIKYPLKFQILWRVTGRNLSKAIRTLFSVNADEGDMP
jgi:hypothetical protein